MTLKILLLAQAPCTAGTFITKFFCNILQPDLLVAESNPWWFTCLSRSDFSPLAPAVRPAIAGQISSSDFLRVFSASLDELFQLPEVKSNGFVVVRDHVFSEFFLARRSFGSLADSPAPFWIEYLRGRGIEYRIVFTTRHPFDSYLGLCQSFPGHARNFTLDSYSLCYISAVSAYKADPFAAFLSIEELSRAGNSHSLLRELSEWAGLRRPNSGGNSRLTPESWESSGASGRKADKPVMFPRRLYGSSLRRQALTSIAYSRLCEYLNYDSDMLALNSRSATVKSLVADVISAVHSMPLAPRIFNSLCLTPPVVQPK